MEELESKEGLSIAERVKDGVQLKICAPFL